MRHPYVLRSALTGTARGGRSRFLVALMLVQLVPLSGCGPGVAEQFLNDVKNFYLNGGLAPAGVADTAASAPEAEGAAPAAQTGTDRSGAVPAGPQGSSSRTAGPSGP